MRRLVIGASALALVGCAAPQPEECNREIMRTKEGLVIYGEPCVTPPPRPPAREARGQPVPVLDGGSDGPSGPGFGVVVFRDPGPAPQRPQEPAQPPSPPPAPPPAPEPPPPPEEPPEPPEEPEEPEPPIGPA